MDRADSEVPEILSVDQTPASLFDPEFVKISLECLSVSIVDGYRYILGVGSHSLGESREIEVLAAYQADILHNKIYFFKQGFLLYWSEMRQCLGSGGTFPRFPGIGTFFRAAFRSVTVCRRFTCKNLLLTFHEDLVTAVEAVHHHGHDKRDRQYNGHNANQEK